MPLGNILVPIFPKVEFDSQLDAALDIVRQVGGHINAVFIRLDPAALMAMMPEGALAVGATVAAIEDEDAKAAATARAKFTEWRSQHALASGIVDLSLRIPYACWSERMGETGAIVASRGRLSDLIIVHRPDPMSAATGIAVDAAIFESGRPTILVPRKVPSNLTRNVLIAWNGSLEATRAVAGAMPLLHDAEEVSVFVAGDGSEPAEDTDLTEFLSWHGIRAPCYRAKRDDGQVGEALLKLAREREATMLVMGAYTHSRLRQMLLGGVTRHVLDHAEIPVLMMH
jgi:nucleotide-binding universal stress UspA family protein